MYAYQQKQQPSLLDLFKTALFIVVVIVFMMISLSTGDLLWFWPVFDETPSNITVHCYGNDITLQPDTAIFSQLTTVFNKNFSSYKNWDSVSMSEISWADYKVNDQFATLVIDYPEKVRVHSIYKYFSNVDTLVVPLDGRHASSFSIFSVYNNAPGMGSFHVETIEPLIEFMNTQGVCPIS